MEKESKYIIELHYINGNVNKIEFEGDENYLQRTVWEYRKQDFISNVIAYEIIYRVLNIQDEQKNHEQISVLKAYNDFKDKMIELGFSEDSLSIKVSCYYIGCDVFGCNRKHYCIQRRWFEDGRERTDSKNWVVYHVSKDVDNQRSKEGIYFNGNRDYNLYDTAIELSKDVLFYDCSEIHGL